MRRASRLSYSPQQRACARSLLGPEHPLARVLTQLTVAVERCVVVAAVLVIGVFALIDDLSIGTPLAVAAAAVLAALVVQVAALAGARNQRALDLIAQGRGEVAVRAVERVRERLLDPEYRERLARSLNDIRHEAERPIEQCHAIPPMYNVHVVRASGAELAEVARLVRGGADLRGVATTEQMITNGSSPLYGDVAEVLRQELGRIRFLLESRE